MNGLIIRDTIREEDLLSSLNVFFSKNGLSVALLDIEKQHQSADVLLEVNPLKGDFSFELSLYENVPYSILDLSVFICRQFKTEVLISDDDINPYTWILINEKGRVGPISQIPNEDDLFLIRRPAQ
jgi:hypothetical protein